MGEVTPRLRGALTRLVKHETDAEPATSAGAVKAAVRLLDLLSERLSVVLGSIGVSALVLRAVALSRREFPFLDTRSIPLERGEGIGEALRACLQEQEPEVIKKASLTILVTVMNLLVTAIGERLAYGLLMQAWPDVLSPEPESREDEG